MENNPYLRRQQHRIGKSGTKSEKRLSKDLGARLRPASGAMEGAKGDMTIGECLIEAKSTINATMGSSTRGCRRSAPRRGQKARPLP